MFFSGLENIEGENRNATPEEQEILSQYVGWGGLADAFDENKSAWAGEYQQLKELLSPEEYRLARESTLNAHYTSPVIIRSIYETLDHMGFSKGNILEPSMGIGNFFGMLPETMRGSRLYGVELDDITGRIAKQLYPGANIQISGFEKTDFPDDFFDIVIGNVPFGNYKVSDKRYDRHNLLVHDYFFAKSIDKVRKGGVIAMITTNGMSGGTFDKRDSKARRYIAGRCDLLGAVRLPSGAFEDADLPTDILFFQKREQQRDLTIDIPDWVQTTIIHESDHVKENGDNYDFVCSVHQDRNHLHMHLIFNSVCRTRGKYHYKKGDWNRIIKPLTNRLADRYHTGHLKERDETLDYSSNYKKGKNGVDWQTRVQNDIDQCISMSKSYSDFKRKMVTEFHYQLREGVSRDYGVYLSLMPPGKGKAVRSYRLDTGYMPADIEAKIEGRYVMPEIDKVQVADMDFHEDSAEHNREISLVGQNRKLDWMMSRNYTFIPYQILSDYQKALVRRTLEAKRMYRRTGTSLQMHEQSVRAVKGMIGEMRDMGVYRKIGGQQTRQSLKQKEPEQQKIQREVRKWRQK